jgi:glycosyltransferase involved in cell wall biosynthesis
VETLTFLLTTSFYPPYHIGGACVHVKYLAEELAIRGYEVHVMHSLDAYRVKRGNRLITEKKKDCTSIYVHTLESPLKKLDPLTVYTLGRSFYVKKKFLEIVKSVHPDVVHHHNISLLGYDILNKEADYISLYTAHDHWLICPMSSLLKNGEEICHKKSCFLCAIKSGRPPQIWRRFKSFRIAVKNIDLIITPSNYIRKRLSKEVNIKSVTLPNFVPFPPTDIPQALSSNYFLFVGMLEKFKGILHLLDLFKELRNNLNARLIIAGEGRFKNYIQNFIKKNSLGDLISYVGFVDDRKKLYSLYTNAMAVIIPSICPENAPLVALEALAAGTPVIASNKGGLPEIIEKVDKKLIFSDWTELKDILLNFSRSEFPSGKIKEIYERNFSPKVYIDNYIRLIQSIGKISL